MFLKPISAAISIGSGGPFGAEGPIIATGGSLGSWIGQMINISAIERKTLLAAGAAAGMTATFGSPIAAVLLAIELLLFEFRPRSLIPVTLATITASAIRLAILGPKTAFTMPNLLPTLHTSILFFLLLGIIIGIASVVITKAVYFVEDSFERLPIHWMWWPAIGGLAVGLIGFFFPMTLGVGYDHIDSLLSGEFTTAFILSFCAMKFLSWVIALGSGTSGGTLAPLFMIGGGLGTLIGAFLKNIFPFMEIDLRSAALVGMAALFAGASRALLTSVVFALETTSQQPGVIPLLAGCTLSYFISSLLMPNTIMTEKIVRRGVHVPHEYTPDYLTSISATTLCNRLLITFKANETISTLRSLFLESKKYPYHGYPLGGSPECL